jgi:hypothetical protein
VPTATKVSTRGRTVPYITVAQLDRSPISNQLKKLVPRSSDNDRDAEMARIILRLSSMINDEVGQNLAATVDTEAGKVRVDSDGHLNIYTRSNPIIEVRSLEVGWSPTQLSPITDLSGLILDPWRITVPNYGRPGARLWARFVYVNGYPVTTLTAAVVAGATTLTVSDATGILPGVSVLTINDGQSEEVVVPTAVVGNVLIVPALEFAHAAGVGVSELPATIEEATLLLLSRLHDTWSLSMGAITTDGSGAKIPGATVKRAMCDAAVMLNPYRRMW